MNDLSFILPDPAIARLARTEMDAGLSEEQRAAEFVKLGAQAVISRMMTRPANASERALTPRQKNLFDFIKGYVAENGYSPSYDEMKAHMGIRSKSGISAMVSALVDRGVISRTPHYSRAITVLV